jgi:predicted amidohydrolase YtcJ
MIHPDLIILNANIITVDNKNSIAEAIAIKDGRIAAVGFTDDLKNLAGPCTKVINAARHTIIPGFIDAHCHLLSIAGRQMLDVDCSPNSVGNINDIVCALKRKAQSTAPGQWILGSSYDHTKLQERRHPTRWELDRVSTEHPVHLRHVSGHLGVVNSKALTVAGFTRYTNDPAGGSFERNSTGDLTGLCREEADFFFLAGIGGEQSIIPPPTAEQMCKGLRMACLRYNSFGITSVGDAAVGPAEIAAYQSAFAAGELTIRVYMIVLDSYLTLLKQLRLSTGFGNEYLRIGSIKSFVDGAIAGGTAWLSEAYEGRAEDFGIQTKSREAILDTISDAHAAGFQVSVHANGDRVISDN